MSPLIPIAVYLFTTSAKCISEAKAMFASEPNTSSERLTDTRSLESGMPDRTDSYLTGRVKYFFCNYK
ncbi:MAG: hypothetical protein EAX81_03280 [Candidatus Thorarchaeota archaeon]|nr:hypothetical protein [Candidatus Thorarchaeota archaeon]